VTTSRRLRRFGAAFAALALTTGLLVFNQASAQATPNGLFDCQQVIYHDILINKPVNGFNCVGPLGVQPPGSIYHIPTGNRYGCNSLEGFQWPDGTIYVFGNVCTPF
jgi:hypothetical protein